MTTATVNQVAAALRDHPDLDGADLHRMLFFVQGYHLALFGRPAFDAAIVADAGGPVVVGFADTHQPYERGVLDPALLNTVLLVVSSHGRRATGNADRLAEAPWLLFPAGEPIDHDTLGAFFTGVLAEQGILGDSDPVEVARIGARVAQLADGASVEVDDLDALLARLRGRKAATVGV